MLAIAMFSQPQVSLVMGNGQVKEKMSLIQVDRHKNHQDPQVLAC